MTDDSDTCSRSIFRCCFYLPDRNGTGLDKDKHDKCERKETYGTQVIDVITLCHNETLLLKRKRENGGMTERETWRNGARKRERSVLQKTTA